MLIYPGIRIEDVVPKELNTLPAKSVGSRFCRNGENTSCGTTVLRWRDAAGCTKFCDCADSDGVDIRSASRPRTIVLAEGCVDAIHQEIIAQARRTVYFETAPR